MSRFSALALLVAVLMPAAGLAQSAAPDPLRADQASPLTYRSAFDGYRSFRADELPPWRSVNDTVRSVGGHTGSMRVPQPPGPEMPHAAAPQAPASETMAPKAMPAIPVQREEAPHGQKH